MRDFLPQQQNTLFHSFSRCLSTSAVVNIISRSMAAKTSKYECFAVRLASYKNKNWPKQMIQTPASLAEAGFFYEGNFDQVRCYCCDGVLDHWEPGDQPWKEHIRHFPDCGFVQRARDEDQSLFTSDDIEDDHLSTDPSLQLADAEMTLREWHVSEPIVQQVLQIAKANSKKRYTAVDCYELAENLQIGEQNGKYTKVHQEKEQFQANPKAACLPSSAEYDGQKCITCPYCNGTITVTDSTSVRRTAEQCVCNQHSNRDVPSTAVDDSKKNIESTDLMQTPATQSVLEMWEDSEKVKQAIDWLNETRGVQSHSAEDIMNVIFDMEEKEELTQGDQQSARQTLHTPMTCKICLKAIANTVCLPCNHMAVCRTCSSNFELCPVCYVVITGLKFAAK